MWARCLPSLSLRYPSEHVQTVATGFSCHGSRRRCARLGCPGKGVCLCVYVCVRVRVRVRVRVCARGGCPGKGACVCVFECL